MDQEELNRKWNELLEEAFDRFIRENVGIREGGIEPACYGTGDAKPQCIVCKFRGAC